MFTLTQPCYETLYQCWFYQFQRQKIGIVFSGETAEHIMDNHIKTPTVHPVKHIRIQQLAKMVKEWDKKGLNIYKAR